jgi:ABC-type multidrug transport system ATPase subunit
MQIVLDRISKRFNREWIFQNVNLTIEAEAACLITGGNGSGKSTLLQITAGSLLPSEGSVTWLLQGKKTEPESVYRHVSLAAPYLELMEEFTLQESVAFQAKFKPWRNGMTNEDVIQRSGLSRAKNKALKYYSSGMRQRVRLTLAILADTPLLLLDEPCSNLDADAMNWYGDLVTQQMNKRTILVCSNRQHQESFFCKQEVEIEAFKSIQK